MPLRFYALLSLVSFTLIGGQGANAASDPALRWVLPLDYQVVQRLNKSTGIIPIMGNYSRTIPGDSQVQARLVGAPGFEEWKTVGCLNGAVTNFHADFAAPAGGWFRLEIRVLQNGSTLTQAVVEHVGIGEVFVICGQSNSANYGDEKQASKSGLVTTFTGKGWVPCKDPQPGAGGTGGSFIPPFGDAMAAHFKLPIGIIAMGVGSTSVREWLPKGVAFPNPPTLTSHVVQLADNNWVCDGVLFAKLTSRLKNMGTNGFRAVLWHQGESDANQKDSSRTLQGELYQHLLEQLIQSARREAGWPVSWFVAQASYHTPDESGSPEIRAAQAATWKSGIATEGPDTDSLTGKLRSGGGQGVHFNGDGLRAHAQLWTQKVTPWIEREINSVDRK